MTRHLSSTWLGQGERASPSVLSGDLSVQWFPASYENSKQNSLHKEGVAPAPGKALVHQRYCLVWGGWWEGRMALPVPSRSSFPYLDSRLE
jgi:hypothetical protein